MGATTVALALLAPAGAAAQTMVDTVGMQRGGVGVHALAGGFVGRLDAHGSGQLDLLGVRAGAGFGEILQVLGFYWAGVDRQAREFLPAQGWGGEAQVQLQAGFGLTPFISAGLARVRLDEPGSLTAATAGAGVMVPLGPVLLRAAVHDYLFGISGLGGGDAEDLTHNWLFSAGVTAAFGRGRSRDPIVVARAEPVPQVVRPATPGDPDVIRIIPDTSPGAPRSYHSERRIEVPLPLEGVITIRYGPEPVAPVALRVDTVLGAAAPVVAPQAGVAAAAPTERMIAQALDRAVASLLPRLEAAEAQRLNALRTELRQALAEQRAELRAEVARLEDGVVRPVGEPAVTRPVGEPALTAPAGAQPPTTPHAAAAAWPHVEAAARPDATASLLRTETEIRIELAALATRQRAWIGAAETERGPAAVIADAAFRTGTALIEGAGRDAAAEIASILRAHPQRVVFVQGHMDGAAGEVAAQALSELRAETVRALLVREGIDPTRVHAIGYGQARPVAGGASAAGRAFNRRVEVVIGAPSP